MESIELVAESEVVDTSCGEALWIYDVPDGKADRLDEFLKACAELLPLEPFVDVMTALVSVELTESVADTEEFNNGKELWVDDVPVDKVSRPDRLSEVDLPVLVPAWLAESGMSENKKPLVLAVLVGLPPSALVSIAPTMLSGAVAVEVGNTLNSAIMDDATWLALSVKNSSMQISP